MPSLLLTPRLLPPLWCDFAPAASVSCCQASLTCGNIACVKLCHAVYMPDTTEQPYSFRPFQYMCAQTIETSSKSCSTLTSLAKLQCGGPSVASCFSQSALCTVSMSPPLGNQCQSKFLIVTADLLTRACMRCRTAMAKPRLVPFMTSPARLSPPSTSPPTPSVLVTLLLKMAQSSLLVSSPLWVLPSAPLDRHIYQGVAVSLCVCVSVCIKSWHMSLGVSLCICLFVCPYAPCPDRNISAFGQHQFACAEQHMCGFLPVTMPAFTAMRACFGCCSKMLQSD